jgi:murein L,D-transpeptidase YcbB/YkuD
MKKHYFFVLFLLFIAQELYSVTITETFSYRHALVFIQEPKIKIDSTLIISYKDSILTSFYKKKRFKTAWDSKKNRDFVLHEMTQSFAEGLEPNDYYVAYLNRLESNFESLSTNQIVEYDIQLTRSFQKFISHLNKGKLNPYQLYDDWDLGKKNTDVNAVLFECLENDNFSETIEKLKPQLIMYQKLKSALVKLNELPETQIDQIDPREKFTPNTTSKSIPNIKRKLLFWGDLKKDTLLTKTYDKQTQAAIKTFQQRHGLKPDGVIGKSTIEALNYSKNQRIEQVVVNLERLRWLPNELGNHYLVVNLPDYTLTVYKDKDSLFLHKIIIGKDSRKTPLLSSQLTNIVLNPNWTVPPTILKEDIFPEARKSRSVFSRKGLHIYDSKNRIVSPSRWRMADAKKYRYVQNPSKNNSLGLMKINFNNNYAVYLHDTNHRDYFAKDFRALSSGCVRVEHPLELAEHLINDAENWSLEKIHEATTNSKKPKTTSIDLLEPIFVHFIYTTSWLENDTLQFREDVYCLDAELYAKLRY